VAGHGIILYFAASHMALPVVAVSGIIILIVIGHRGLFGPWYALLRRKCRNDAG
jgi:hypothetical protein